MYGLPFSIEQMLIMCINKTRNMKVIIQVNIVIIMSHVLDTE